jgi:hypothetical protein
LRAPSEGEPLVIAGFGTRDTRPVPGTSWPVRTTQRHERVATVRFVSADVVALDTFSIPGDSGGPLIATDTNEVVGVVSHGKERTLMTQSSPARTLVTRLDSCPELFGGAHPSRALEHR